MATKISHLAFDEVNVRVTGQMLSEDTLPYLSNGRRVLFTPSDGVSAGREIYVLIDDQLQGPFRNGQALETGVEFWEKFLPMPHTGGIYVVDTKPYPVDFNSSFDVPVCQSNGQVLSIKTSVTFAACQMRCRDGRAMLEEYLSGTFRDPEEEGRYTIQQAVQQTVRSRIAAASLEGDAMRVHQELKQMELTMGDQVCKAANNKVSWLRFQNASLQISISNLDELLTQLNRGYEMRMSAQQLLIEASIKYFDRDSINEPAMALLTRFVETNPGASEEQIEKMTNLVAQLGKRITPAEMLAFGVKAGLLDAASALKLKP